MSLRLTLIGLRVFATALGSQTAAPEVVLRAATAPIVAGAWTVIAEPTAAGGTALGHPDAGAAKLSAALATPANYFELSFSAQAGIAYRLWVRGRADRDYWTNDSVFVQFSGSVDGAGVPRFEIDTTSAAIVTIEDCNGCGVSGWGWQDNGYGGLGPAITFGASGPQRIRIQTREDGLSIDQVVLSPERYLSVAPGALKNDTVILPRVQ